MSTHSPQTIEILQRQIKIAHSAIDDHHRNQDATSNAIKHYEYGKALGMYTMITSHPDPAIHLAMENLEEAFTYPI